MKEEIKRILDKKIVKRFCDSYLFMKYTLTFSEKNNFSLDLFETKINEVEAKLYSYDEDKTYNLSKDELFSFLDKIKKLDSDTSERFFKLMKRLDCKDLEKFTK